MIPRHSPPFGLTRLFSLTLRGSPGVRDLESACADALGTAAAVLLPSARAGILWSLVAAAGRQTVVAGPAFVCGVVHEAMLRCGFARQFVDSVPGGFLMDVKGMSAPAGPWILLLSEAYGLRFPRESLELEPGRRPLLRLWDMAMCVPEPADLARLDITDAALVSFGLGKCMYAGWGGVLLSNNLELAGRVRELRDGTLSGETFAVRARHGLSIVSRTALHLHCVYRLGRTLAQWREAKRHGARPPETSSQPIPAALGAGLSREWNEPMTALNRTLALDNLQHMLASAELRRHQAEKYHRLLEPLGVVQGFGGEALPQSHFPIRVAPAARANVRRYLWNRGIDTATYFPFPPTLRRSEYPHAARAADEVVLLPLGRSIRIREVETIAKHVRDAIGLVST